MRIISLLFAVFVLAFPIVAQAQFTYTTNNGAITVTGYTGAGGAVMIPGTINGYPVTCIGDWAFYANSVTNVLIADSVTNIGDGAFFNCESLTTVTLGSGVTRIGDWAFSFCPALTSICSRGNAPSLGGADVFYGNAATIFYLAGATGWGSMFVGHPAILWNPPVPFTYTVNGDGLSLTITRYAGSDENVIIPRTINFLPITSIGDYGFAFNSGLTEVIIPDSVHILGNGVFADCYSLTSLAGR